MDHQITDLEHWDTKWRGTLKHTRTVSRNDPYYGYNGIFLRTLRRHFGDIEGLNIIELGGAGSYYLLALAKWGKAKATAIDYSPHGIRQTQAIFEKNDCLVETILHDLFTWNYGHRKYDLVVHWGLLEHFTDPSNLLALCSNLVGPNGRVIFTMPNMEALGAHLWKLWSPLNWQKHIYYSDGEIEILCKEAGLQLEKTFFWGPPLLQMAKWQYTGIAPQVVTILQRCLNQVGKTIPIYHYGWRNLSQNRGFIALKSNQG